ncbi:TadE/TadG family type IV pilus assembly protein [Vibrio mediterranei]
MMKSLRQQNGVAIIVVALTLIALSGAIQLAIESGRMLQEKNRLADATEAATLAVSIANRKDPLIINKLARQYLEHYVPSLTFKNISVKRDEGIDIIDENPHRYVKYEVKATGDLDKSIDVLNSKNHSHESYKIANNAMAKTYMLPTDMDLVFVADFSGSMTRYWHGKSQLAHLKQQINTISSELISPTATKKGYMHRVGFVPFNLRTKENISGSERCITQLEYHSIPVSLHNHNYNVSYTDINWEKWGKLDRNTVNHCAYGNSNSCPHFLSLQDAQKQAKAITRILDSNTYHIPDSPNYIDYQNTINHWQVNKTEKYWLHPQYFGTQLFQLCPGNFHTIPLSTTKPNIDSMSADGGTAVFQGLLRGAQILVDGRPDGDNPLPDANKNKKYNKRAQMLLILSDGDESYKTIFSHLVENGLCTQIRRKFSTQDRPLYIGVIGINFHASSQSAFQKCADEIIDVTDSDKLLEKIREIIVKGASGGGISRLYDKNS